MRYSQAAVVLLLILPAVRGGESGRLRGSVSDGSQALVPGTLISCVQEETGFRFAALSNNRGEYEIVVPEGHYNIVARQTGFRAVARMAVFVVAGSARQINFRLEPGGVSELLTISDSISPRPFSEEDGSTVLRPEDVRGAPQNDRTVSGLLRLAPGVLITPANGGEPGQFSSLGARPNDNSFVVDGVRANNAVGGGGWPSFLPGAKLPAMTALGTTHGLVAFEAIETVSIQPQSSTPEDGYALGANVAIQTRAGTERFHGSLFAAARPALLGANDWFANRYGLGDTAPALNEGGVTLGGPLRPARTFFFVSAEMLRLRQTSTWQTTVPSLAARELAPPSLQGLLNEFPLPNGPSLNSFGIALLVGSVRRPASIEAGSVRLDQALSAKARAFLRLAYTPSSIETGWTQANLAAYRNAVAALGITWDSNRWTYDTRLGFNRILASSRWLGRAAGDLSGVPFYSQFGSSGATLSGVAVAGAGSVATGEEGRNRQDQIQVSQSAMLRLSRHTFKAGLEYQQWHPKRFGPTSNTNVTLGTPTDAFYPTPAPVWVTISEFHASQVRLHQLSGFAQDTWSARPNLNFTFGARWLSPFAPRVTPSENLYVTEETVGVVRYSPAPAGSPFWHGPALLLDPKASAAWRPFGHADAVARASWGVFHDPAFAVATDPLNGAPSLLFKAPDGYSSTQLQLVQLGEGIASDLRVPVSYRWDISWQQSWRGRDWLAVSYSCLAGRGLLRREIVLNPAPPLGQLSIATNHGKSDYRGLTLAYKRALSNGLDAIVSYSWSQAIDLGSTDAELFLIGPGRNARTDRGPSDFDARHALSGAVSYTLPGFTGWRKIAEATGGWTLGAFVYARTGFPIDVILSDTLEGFAAGNLRPSVIHGVPFWVADSNAPGGRRLNSAAFLPWSTAASALARNSIRGASLWQLDLAADRSFRLSDSFRLLLRAEAYNAANHPQFADPVRFLSNPLFGQSSSPLNLMYGGGSPTSGQSPPFQMGGPRSFQVSLRLSF